MTPTSPSIHPTDPWAAFPQLVALGVGIVSILTAIVGGFGWLSLTRALEFMPFVNGQVFMTATFPLERWLLVAVFVTGFYSLIFYLVFVIQLVELHRNASESDRETVVAAIVVFPVVNTLLLASIGYLMLHYCGGLGRVDSLKLATGMLLVSFVVNDLLSMLFGTKAESAKHLKTAGWNALIRLDLPVLAAFLLLIAFVQAETDGGRTSVELISAFSLGAAAFKLLVTVAIFTLISYEEYVDAISRRTIGEAR